MSFSINRMTKDSWGKVRAFFDIEVEGFTLKGFKIMEGINGLFVSFPSIQNKEGEYNDTIYVDKELRDKINHNAKEYYETLNKKDSNTDDAPFSAPQP